MEARHRTTGDGDKQEREQVTGPYRASQAQELAALIADKGPQAALAQISGLDANSEVVSEAVTAYKAMQ